jgi:GrpB-like predicted nucleotidyltransferase (UPF0157 family)
MIAKNRINSSPVAWEQRYQEIHEEMRAAVGDLALAIVHIGNTSFPCLLSSPAIDVMVGVSNMEVADLCVERLSPLGYEALDEGGGPDQRFLRRSSADSQNVRVHIVERSGEFWSEQLLFRNFLREHRDKALEYAHLTKQLAAKDDPEAKAEFVAEVLRQARSVD